MKRTLFFFVLLIFSSAVLFSWGGEFDYLLGYNYESEDVNLFQAISTDIFTDAQTDYGYFYGDFTASFFHGISMDASSVFSNPLLTCEKKNDGMLPSYPSLMSGMDRFLLNLNELYYEYSFTDYTLRFGRFKLQKGSGNIYSPSDVLSSQSLFGIDGIPHREAIDGVLLQGFYDYFDMEVYFSPFTKMSFPTSNTMLKTLEGNFYLQAYATNFISQIDFTPIAVIPVKSEYSFQQDYPLDFHTSNFGVKFGFSWFDILWKVAYYRDHFHFQVPQKITQKYTKISTDTTLDGGITIPASSVIYESQSKLIIPSRNVITIDMQGNMTDSTIYYFEGALFIPEDVNTILSLEYNGLTQNDSIKVFKDPVIAKCLFGIEYSGDITGWIFEENEFTLGMELFNSLPEEYFTYSPGFDVFLRVNKDDFDLETLAAVAFTKINDEWKFGTSITGNLIYRGLDLVDVILSASWNYSDEKNHPFYLQKDILNKIAISAIGYF